MSDEHLTIPDQNVPAVAERAITRVARRRSWNEPVVRGWLLGAVVMLVLAANVALEAVRQTDDVNNLLATATAVDATVFMKDRGQGTGAIIPPGMPLSLHFIWNGRARQLDGSLPEDAGMLVTGQTVVIHVDPDNTSHWTGHTVKQNWWGQSISAVLLIALAGMLIGIASLLRWQRLRVFRFGQLLQVDVMQTSANPLAPMSTSASCALPESFGSGAISVSVPRSAGKVQAGDVIPVILVPQRPRLALAANAYLKNT